LENIQKEIENRSLRIAVIGLGWMGLPTACLLAEVGFNVTGVDVDLRVVKAINEKKTPIAEPGIDVLVKKNVDDGRLRATSSAKEAAANNNAIIIIVPTCLTENKKPDYTAVEKACREIGRSLKKGSIVVLESTIGPGSTEGFVKDTLERTSGLKAGEDFSLAYSPIRGTAGRVIKDIQSYPRIVGGLDKRSLDLASSLIESIVKDKIIKVKNLRTAEAVKLLENIYRDVNIALVNEISILCERLGIDFDEAMQAANSQPYSHLHSPSMGVGGHCIPVNPYFLLEKADDHGVDLRMMKLARKINDNMYGHAMKLISDALRVCGKKIRRSKIAVLGVSFRANAKDTRHSVAKTVIEALQKKGATVTVFDPKFTGEELKGLGYNGFSRVERAVENADCILMTVGHEEFKTIPLSRLGPLMKRPAAIIDCGHIIDPVQVEKEGFVYRGIGRGVWTK
jgi:UDP-N-acetyl-D-mannosaminuronic acid dehydrogenase